MLNLQRKCATKGIQMMLDTTENESLITRARNIAIARFLYKTTAEYFIFIDADIHFQPDAIIRLIESGHDVTVACYPKKVIMWDQAEQAIKTGDDRNIQRLASSLVLNFKYAKSSVVNGYTEVLDGPTGFMCIKRNVIEKMYEHYKKDLMCVNDHQNRDLDEYCAIFDCMIDPENRRYLSEDYAFCRRWQLMGGTIYADVTTVLGHVGNLRFSGSM
jgi:glycosyltransferase involved in cell wall biosynthesis